MKVWRDNLGVHCYEFSNEDGSLKILMPAIDNKAPIITNNYMLMKRRYEYN